MNDRRRQCFWCQTFVNPGRRARILAFNDTKFYFHVKCRAKFQEHYPTTWIKRLEEAAARK